MLVILALTNSIPHLVMGGLNDTDGSCVWAVHYPQNCLGCDVGEVHAHDMDGCFKIPCDHGLKEAWTRFLVNVVMCSIPTVVMVVSPVGRYT